MVHVMVFSVNEVKLEKTRDQNRKAPRSCEHGDCVRDLETLWRGAHTEIVHVHNSDQDLTQNTQKMGSEQRDGRMDEERERERPELWRCVDDDEIDKCGDEWLEPLEAAASFYSKTMHRVSISSSCSSPKLVKLSTVKKKTAVLKRAMTEKWERWQIKERYGKTKSRWQQSAGEDGGQSSHDMWKNSQTQGTWREISAEIDAVGTTVKEKTNTWNRSCKESAKWETELHKMVEAAVMDNKQEQKERGMIRDLLEQLQREGKKRMKQEA